ncbi:pheromone A receptor-domain-containing protein [Vararia minispora EC-137]|uniref:Pheromone A receptor-domain-containing protein n=1 Tax=Vararia minispora EC-137 TaxID=1314806 RepID=A0ACB8QV40_9AGAM|nr:pheromone A receptor-domain-containing protein [Vararia minispora EC-137]
MVGAPNELFSAISFVAFVLCVIPLYWHLEAWNIGTCMFILWAGFGSLVFFINSIIWNHNVVNWAPVWCDISTRFLVGLSVGIPATSLAINRRLYKISSVRQVMVTRSERRREMAIDIGISVIFPCIVMALQYVVQGHRFNIYEDIGCLPYTWNTPLAYVLYYMWPLVTGVCAATYCILTIRNFHRRGRALREVLTSHSNLNHGRYVRLMMLAGMELFATIPITTYIIYTNSTLSKPLPWVSWADTHYGFSRVDQFPRALWGDSWQFVINLEMQRWLTIMCAFVFVAFFGFASEARAHYRAAYTSLASRLGVTTIGSGSFSDSRVLQSTSRRPVRPSSAIHSHPVSRRRSRSEKAEQLTPTTPTTPTTPHMLSPYSPTVYSPTDDQLSKFSPTESVASSSFGALPFVTPSEPITAPHIPTDVPVIRAPEAAIHRPRPESEILAVERPSDEFKGASAV